MLKNLIILIIITVVAIFIWQFEFKNNAGGGFEVKGYDSIGSSAENIPRVALVMGIASYKNAVFGSYEFGKLGNPVNDAVDMAKVLVNLGFTVILKQNLAGKREMTQAILEFRNKLPKNGRAVALFYFSGHGFQYKNVNYLVPSQMKIDSEIDVEYEVLSADYVLKHLKVANAQGTNLIFLDACRNDIPADAFGRWNSMGVDDVKAGFAVMKAPIGSLIAYSTAPKMAAWSATGARNSVYTKHLLKALETQPNANVINLLMSVRKGVLAETKDIKDKQGNSLQQATWEHFSLTDSFCFGGCVSDDLFQQRLAKIAAMEQAVRDREEALELEKERFEQQAITREAEFKRELAEKARKAAELKREQQQAEKQFQFVKLNYRGRRLTNSASSWSCVKDTHSGLIWEKKSKGNKKQGDNLHDADDRYTWYNTDDANNGGSDGYADNDYNRDCYAYRTGKASSYCNTQAYTARVNAENYCGFNDWRMPTKDELLSLVDKAKKSAKKPPTINTDYFPNTPKYSWYWSGSPLAGNPSRAWNVGFLYGYDYDGYRNDGKPVRLVRGGQ